MTPDLYFNLGDYGFPEWVSVSRYHLQSIAAAGESLLARWNSETAEILIEEMTDQLQQHIGLGYEPDLHWVLSAMMIIYLRGQVRGEIPEFFRED